MFPGRGPSSSTNPYGEDSNPLNMDTDGAQHRANFYAQYGIELPAVHRFTVPEISRGFPDLPRPVTEDPFPLHGYDPEKFRRRGGSPAAFEAFRRRQAARSAGRSGLLGSNYDDVNDPDAWRPSR
jgi:hypothetical protein